MSWLLDIKAVVGRLGIEVTLREKGGALALIGPNGSGKTSLLRMFAGAYPVRSGCIELIGKPLFDSSKDLCVPSEDRRVGYLPQGYALFPHLRVDENVGFALEVESTKPSREERRSKVAQILNDLGCSELANRFPHQLSGGEKQRVALARALVSKPQILLLDEPLAALDVSLRRSVRNYLVEHLQQTKRPSIWVTHDVRDVHALASRVAVLEKGRVVQVGTAEELRQKPATPFVAEFFESEERLNPAGPR